MDEKTLELLEFDVIRERVAERARSAEARRRILLETPLADEKSAEALKRNAALIAAKISGGGAEPDGLLPDIEGLLPVLDVEGAAFSADEGFAIGGFVKTGRAILRWLDGLDIAAGLPDCSAVEKEVFRVLDRDGKLLDLPALKEIRGRIAALNRELRRTVASYTANGNLRRMLQSDIPSQRDGRIVIALKHQFKGRIRGIIHEVSASGQTLFIEPEDVVEKNNEILLEQRRYDAEVRRILREMTAGIAEHKEALALFHDRLIFIETLRARARYSVNTGGVFLPAGGAAGEDAFFLKEARHPLLGGKAVPVDIKIAGRVLVISGPNAGGKTAALKTAGLFALMNQAGLALPLAEGSSLPFFESVFACIGDDQSLERSLSTFSAHIEGVACILEKAGAASLVLFDELCAGTDSAEGGAIAMAVLDSIIEKNCFCIVTTHHGALKNYAFSNSGVENASVEFDAAAPAPSYRLVTGLPGESHALDISLRRGLPPFIVERARRYLENGGGDVSALIAGLREKNRAAEDALRQVQAEQRRLLEERRAAALREQRLRQREAGLGAEEAGALRRFLDESRKTLENLVRELKEGEVTREKTLKVKDFLRQLEKTAEAETAEPEDAANMGDDALLPGDACREAEGFGVPIRAGLRVLAGPKRLEGLVRRPAKKGFWVVETGSISMTFSEKDLAPAVPVKRPPKTAAAGSSPPQVDYCLPVMPAVQELNVCGMRLDDAIEELQRQIDSAMVSGLWDIAVIHGKGDGILQHGVHEYLKNQTAVEEFHFSRPELGGFGRTEVTLKH
jgi:DNA mismatch repair protein MutS2